MDPSIFLDFNLPNAATWFYFSVILTVALFFQFSAPHSIRNFDLVGLFLLVPGFLLLQEGQDRLAAGDGGGWRSRAVGYVWLIAGSGYWFLRTVLDLALVRRPTLAPNLTTAGLGWFGLALFVCLTAVAVRRTAEPVLAGPVGSRPIPIEQLRETATGVVQQTQPASPADVRFWVERGLAMACHLAVVLGLLFIGLKHFGNATAGMAAGTLYLLVPYTAFHIGQLHLVWPAAFVTWAVFWYRRPTVSGVLLGLAAGSAFVPLLLVPLWAGFYAGRGLGRFLGGFGAAFGVAVGLTAVLLWWDGWTIHTLAGPMADWLPWRRTLAEGLWKGAHGAYRLPVFVPYLAFVLGLAVWPSPKSLSQLIALSAAVLIGVQFWHPDRGGLYVLWYLPLVILVVLRPTLALPEPGWVVWGRRAARPGQGVTDTKSLAV